MMLSCRELEERFVAADGALNEDRELRAHLDVCAHCAKVVRLLEHVDGAMAQVPDIEVPETSVLRDRVLRRLSVWRRTRGLFAERRMTWVAALAGMLVVICVMMTMAALVAL